MNRTEQAPAGFYDSIAAGYDRMVQIESRIQGASVFVALLGQRFAFATAADIGCGTGAYALALARQGVRAIGIDPSAEMLRYARAHGRHLGLEAEWLQGTAVQALPRLGQPLDLILCMGNTLPHVTDQDELHHTLAGIHAALAPDGYAVIQVLNYERILAAHDRIVSIDREADRQFVRFYDFLPGGLVRFNVLTIHWEADHDAGHRLESVLLHPYTRADLQGPLEDAGLRCVETWGGLDCSPFDQNRSDTLLLLLSRR
jgi:SAM-dependent methyltransferase